MGESGQQDSCTVQLFAAAIVFVERMTILSHFWTGHCQRFCGWITVSRISLLPLSHR